MRWASRAWLCTMASPGTVRTTGDWHTEQRKQWVNIDVLEGGALPLPVGDAKDAAVHGGWLNNNRLASYTIPQNIKLNLFRLETMHCYVYP